MKLLAADALRNQFKGGGNMGLERFKIFPLTCNWIGPDMQNRRIFSNWVCDISRVPVIG